MKPLPRFSTSRAGSVLIVVLIVSLGLVSLTLMFGHSMLLAYRGADNDLAGRQAEQAIEGAARYVESVIASGTAGQMPDSTSYQNAAVPVGDAQFWIIGKPGDTDAVDAPAFGLVDEASKLNINAASVETLQALPGMTAELAAAIKDWRDKDEIVTSGGAESETYGLRQPAYRSKNAPFESIEELALVNGATMSILYGEDTNLNRALDANEDDGSKTPPDDNSDNKLDAGILNYVTAYSREPNTQADGTPRVNVSLGWSQELNTLISGTFDASRAAQIRGALGNAKPKSPLEFYIRSRMTEDEFNQISTAITSSTATNIIGLVNVNTASQTVLECILSGTGIDTSKAADLVSTRASYSTPPASVAWVRSVLGDGDSVKVGPLITAQSWQFSADVAAVGKNGRGYRRTWFVIDNTGTAPKIVYRRNMSQYGWALGDAVRQTLVANEEPKK